MKKKIFLGLMLCTVALSLFGCGKTIEEFVENNISEKAVNYFFGECEQFYVTLSAGVREEDYNINGKGGAVTDYALISLRPIENLPLKKVTATIKIDEEVFDEELVINGMNGCYMSDLARKISGEEKIEVTFQEETVALENLAKDFQIGADDAIKIACENFQDKILKEKSWGKLNAECYLRVLDKKANNFDDMYWCFTVVNVKNENYSIIISTKDGTIFAKSK